MASYTFPNLPASLNIGDTIRFNYTGAPQTLNCLALNIRKVKIQVWGARGGTGNSTRHGYTASGGQGGYAEGVLDFGGNIKDLHVYVGGAGGTNTTGGWNGGGNGTGNGTGFGGPLGAGGGATDVRTVLNSNPLDVASLSSRLIVAGGGGGGSTDGGSAGVDRGGHGGGFSGEGGGRNLTEYVGTQVLKTTPAVQGTFGKGADSVANDRGAGGGGWYGGGAPEAADHPGTGGSSYIAGHPSCPAPHPDGYKLTNGTTSTGGNYGAGYAILTVEGLAVTKPNTPSSISKPSTAKVGQTVQVSWASVPLPTQPSGTQLTSNTVYYEVDFYDGVKWVSATAKTTATSLNFTIPTMADTTSAKFRVRAFLEAYGSKHYSESYRESTALTVYNNNKPTVPLAFSAPIASSRYRVGFNYTVSWGASTDLDNDPLTYQLDFFNGSSWVNVASGIQATNRSFIIPSGADTLNAQFRVRAYDGRDYSDYRYSDKFEVFNSLPPNTPRPFIKPTSGEMRVIDQQTAYEVSWGHADADRPETAVKYEVSFRPTSLDNWTVIRDINHADATKTSMTHIIPNVQDSPSAQYRVRAYDGYEYGGYTESNQFNISGNKVTNTSGFNQELMDRMAINQEVRLSWQPAETARNTDVVYDIEVFDGFNWNEVAYNVPSTSLVFRIPPMEDTPNAKIRIRSKTPFQYGGYVESPWAETTPFTIVNFFIFDSIAVPFLNDVQKKENADYLRQKVNDMRIVNDLPPLVYTDPVIIRYETAIKAVHFDEIERGILECFDTNPRAKFSNARTEQELRKVKEYADQAELIQELPQRIDFICKALMNQ